jgi:hypothetical protein
MENTGHDLDPRIPLVLHPLLQDYISLANKEMKGKIAAFYLEGSVALGGFNERLSDIDFIAVLTRKSSTKDVEKIQGIHAALAQQYPRWHLSGIYFQHKDLGCHDNDVQPHLNYHDGKLKWSEQFSLSAVTWWILKNKGITVFGSPADSLPYTVDMDYLIRTQQENMNIYWASWTTRLDGLLGLLSDWGVQWTVLGTLRQYFTIQERQLTTKVKAGEYGLEHLPDRWHRIIQEAISLREPEPKSLYRSRLKRAIETYRFLKFIIQTCNEFLDAQPA